MADDKKVVKKIEQKPPSAPPSSVPARDDKVKITFSLDIDKGVKQKAPFLVAILVLFLFACLMFSRANFSIGDLFNFQRVQDNFEKLYSVSFLLFVVLLSLDMALAAVYGAKLDSQTALASMFLLAIPLLVAYLVSPRYVLAYLAMAFPVALTAFFSSLQDKLNLSTAYSSMSKAMLVFIILAAAFTFVKVQADKDYYFDSFLSNIVKLAPSVQGQLQGSVADAIEDIEINASTVASVIGPQADGAAAAIITREQVAASVAESYDAFRQEMVNSFPDADERNYAASKMPLFSALPQAKKDAMVNAIYDKLTASMAGSSEENPELAATIAAMWPKIRKALADEVRNAPTKSASSIDLAALKSRLAGVSVFRAFYDNFEAFIALVIFSVLSVVAFIFKILGTLFAFALAKLIA